MQESFKHLDVFEDNEDPLGVPLNLGYVPLPQCGSRNPLCKDIWVLENPHPA